MMLSAKNVALREERKQRIRHNRNVRHAKNHSVTKMKTITGRKQPHGASRKILRASSNPPYAVINPSLLHNFRGSSVSVMSGAPQTSARSH